MAYLNRKQILAAKLPTRDVEVAEWGGDVCIRALSVKHRVEMLDAWVAHEREVDAYKEDQALPEDERKGVEKVTHLDQAIFQLIYSIVDPKTDKLLFSMADYEAFKELNYPTIQRLYGVFIELNSPKSVSEVKKSSG
jgi:hypothetical protein